MKPEKRISLAVKINLLIIAAILVVAAGLVGVGYRAFGKRIDEIFVTETERYSNVKGKDIRGHIWSRFR